jgi:hypothetical protein
MLTNQDASASNPVTKNPPATVPPAPSFPDGPGMTRAEIVAGLRDIFGKYGIRMTPAESQTILGAVYKLEMQP